MTEIFLRGKAAEGRIAYRVGLPSEMIKSSRFPVETLLENEGNDNLQRDAVAGSWRLGRWRKEGKDEQDGTGYYTVEMVNSDRRAVRSIDTSGGVRAEVGQCGIARMEEWGDCVYGYDHDGRLAMKAPVASVIIWYERVEPDAVRLVLDGLFDEIGRRLDPFSGSEAVSCG